jgi:hypothetical protein
MVCHGVLEEPAAPPSQASRWHFVVGRRNVSIVFFIGISIKSSDSSMFHTQPNLCESSVFHMWIERTLLLGGVVLYARIDFTDRYSSHSRWKVVSTQNPIQAASRCAEALISDSLHNSFLFIAGDRTFMRSVMEKLFTYRQRSSLTIEVLVHFVAFISICFRVSFEVSRELTMAMKD